MVTAVVLAAFLAVVTAVVPAAFLERLLVAVVSEEVLAWLLSL